MKQDQTKSSSKEKDLVFYIKVQYRCNSSMQGTVQWMDGKKTEIFRSVLELGNLINDARQKATGNKNGYLASTVWEEKEIVS